MMLRSNTVALDQTAMKFVHEVTYGQDASLFPIRLTDLTLIRMAKDEIDLAVFRGSIP